MSRADFDSLTRTEKAFIMRAYEQKVIFESQMVNKAVINAMANVRRKKGQRFRPLWKKRPKHAETNSMQIEVRKAATEKDKSWVDRIYQANGLTRQLAKLRKGQENG